MGDLTPRQKGKMRLAKQAENYLKYKHQQRSRTGSSLSHTEYDVDQSRREWKQSFQ